MHLKMFLASALRCRPARVDLHRILSSYRLAHFYLMKKSAKVLHYFGLDCGMLKFFTHEP
jgi:hypothetical protein